MTDAAVTRPDSSADPTPGLDARTSSRDRRLAVAAVTVAVLPIVVAVVRALLHHWIPVSDNGVTAIRTEDVFSRFFPWWGQASSASLAAPKPLNHPGPLQFVLLAPPTALLGPGPGLAIGTGVLNGAAVVIAAWAAWRRAAVVGSVLASVVAGALAWSMGSELLYDPWPAHALMLPTLAFCVLAWAIADGDQVLAPLAVGVGSLMVQTHLTAAYLVPGLLALGVLVGWRAARGRRRGLIMGIAVLVGVVLWIPPLVEEIGARDGNITRLVDQVRHPPRHTVGAADALRLTARIVVEPPAWARPSLRDSLREAGGSLKGSSPSVDALPVPSTTNAVLMLAGLGVLLGGLAWWAVRRRDRTSTVAVATAGGALVLAWYTAAQITTQIVGVAPHQFRFIWPVAAFVTFAALLAVARAFRSPAAVARIAIGGTAVVALLAALNLPTSPASGGPQVDEPVMASIRAVNRQLGALEADAPVLADWSGIAFQEPYSGAFTAELRDRDIPFVTASPYQVRHYGTQRRFDGTNAKTSVFYRLGHEARRRFIGAFHRVAYTPAHDGAPAIGVYAGPVTARVPAPRS